MNHIITTYGGGELFTLVFNGIAALFKEDRTGMVMSLIRVGLMVGSVYVIILMLFRQQLIEGMRWFLWVVIATNLIFLPKTTIFIHDPLSNTKSKVDHVPYALGAFASFVSEVGRSVTEKFESVFTLPDYMPYHKTGTVFASALMSQVGHFRIVDPVFKGNMERFVNQCVVYDAMIGHKYTLSDLQNTPDIWKFVSSQASPVLGFLYKEGTNPGTIITCKEGAQKLSHLWVGEIKKAAELYGTRVQNRKLTESAFFTDLMGSAKLLSEGKALAESAQNLLRQEMMINAIEESSNNKLSELGSPSNYAATKALLQQRSTYAAAGEIAARTLPLFKNVVEALSYALFIFIVVLALLPNGSRILVTYFGILIWTQLWAPLYAVLNLIMTLYGTRESMGHGFDKGLTLLNSSAIINANTDMTTLAAWLSVSIPFISYGILRQGAGAFVGLAQHLGSAMQSASSGAAAETVSGNISLGNISMGTQAYQNTSAFQHNTSPSYSASQLRALSASGIETSTFAGGTQSLTDHAMSHLGVQIMGTENTSFTQQESLNTAKSTLHSKSIAANEATESSLQQITNFLSQVGENISRGTDLSKTISASEAKSLQDFTSYVNDIQQKTGLSYAQAVEVGVAAKMGTPEVLGFGLSAHGSFSSQAANHQDIAEAQSIAQQKNYTENLERVLSAAQSYSKTKTGTNLAELGEGATSTLNHAKSLLEQVSVAQNQVDTISKDLSSSQSQSFTINKDLTQPLLEFIAHQPVNTGPTGSFESSGGKIGYEGAHRILEQEGPERQAYFSRFQEEHPQYKIQSIHYGQEQASIEPAYKREATKIRGSSDLSQQHLQNTQEVLNRGQDRNLNLDSASDSSLKMRKEQENSSPKTQGQAYLHNTSTLSPAMAKVQPPTEEQEMMTLLQTVDKQLNERKKELSTQEDHLQKEREDSKKQTLGGAALKNLGKSFADGVISVAEDLPTDPPIIIP
ncbi:MAG: conjugal transfer protein TraG N-terminal domain-containing protein [Proteobacteria bacterium]|nr:conjugal transfer protein TraG N-terminal domain-containing protein [Pseudomonadota bacterium]